MSRNNTFKLINLENSCKKAMKELQTIIGSSAFSLNSANKMLIFQVNHCVVNISPKPLKVLL